MLITIHAGRVNSSCQLPEKLYGGSRSHQPYLVLIVTFYKSETAELMILIELEQSLVFYLAFIGLV